MARIPAISPVLIALVVAMLVPRSAAAQDDCVDVLGCQWCRQSTEEDSHRFSTAGAQHCNNDEYNPYHSEWRAGHCNVHHGTCIIERLEEHAATLTALISKADPRALARYALSYSGQVVVNSDRSAVQLHGCGGKVIGHIPLTAEAMAAVHVAMAGVLENAASGGARALVAPAPQMSLLRYLELAAN